ncbi:hypothetical protein EMMF5_000897 [Cystobasidiomycetes sp. EMM_F5]
MFMTGSSLMGGFSFTEVIEAGKEELKKSLFPVRSGCSAGTVKYSDRYEDPVEKLPSLADAEQKARLNAEFFPNLTWKAFFDGERRSTRKKHKKVAKATKDVVGGEEGADGEDDAKHLPAILKCQDLSLKAVYSRSEGSAQSLAAASRKLGLPGIDVYHGSDGLAKVLSRDDIQTVVVCLPITFQPEIIQAAWRAGKNVISEKPIAKDVATAKQLIDIYETTYRSTGIQWIIAEQFPYETAYVKVHEMLSQGVIGELRSFSLEWNNNVTPENPYYNTAWRKNPEYQGGFLLDGGVHFVAGIRYLLSALGVQMASVSAFNCLIRDDLAPFDTLQGVIKTDNERVGGTFIISMAHEVSKPSGYVIRGSKAIITVKSKQAEEMAEPPSRATKKYQARLYAMRRSVIMECPATVVPLIIDVKYSRRTLEGSSRIVEMITASIFRFSKESIKELLIMLVAAAKHKADPSWRM